MPVCEAFHPKLGTEEGVASASTRAMFLVRSHRSQIGILFSSTQKETLACTHAGDKEDLLHATFTTITMSSIVQWSLSNCTPPNFTCTPPPALSLSVKFLYPPLSLNGPVGDLVRPAKGILIRQSISFYEQHTLELRVQHSTAYTSCFCTFY